MTAVVGVRLNFLAAAAACIVLKKSNMFYTRDKNYTRVLRVRISDIVQHIHTRVYIGTRAR